MGTWPRTILARLFALLALAASAALLVDAFRPRPQLCSFEEGCETVLTSSFARPCGVPLPVLGVAAFLAYLVLSVLPRTRRLAWGLGLAAGGAGCALLVIQVAVLGEVCPWCVMTDVSAVAIACCEALGARQGRENAIGEEGRLGRALWLAGGTAALALGLTYGAFAGKRPREVPPEVKALHVPGKVTVVEVSDFECPHCRNVHRTLSELLPAYGDRVRLVRIAAPMPTHAGGHNAARAYLCALEQGKGEAMADRLFHANDLSPEGCEKIAEALGLSLSTFRACVAKADTKERIEKDVEWAKATHFGLPAVWVEDRLLDSDELTNPEALRAALREAEERLKEDSPQSHRGHREKTEVEGEANLKSQRQEGKGP
jgi:uncharacterized membrane protein/protein-disulfide isomerase